MAKYENTSIIKNLFGFSGDLKLFLNVLYTFYNIEFRYHSNITWDGIIEGLFLISWACDIKIGIFNKTG